MRASLRWSKADLVQAALALKQAGYDVTYHGYDYSDAEFSRCNKLQLVNIINDAERPDRVWGVDVNDLQIEKTQWQWVVRKPNGKLLCTIGFTEAYDWLEAQHSTDFLTAMEACLVMCPLTTEERARLEEKRPGITSKQLFEVDLEAWDIEDEPEPEPWTPPPAPKAKPQPAEPRPLSPKRKIRL